MGLKCTKAQSKEEKYHPEKPHKVQPSNSSHPIPQSHYEHSNNRKSSAERYIDMRAQMMNSKNNDPLTKLRLAHTMPHLSHEEKMHQWKKKEIPKIDKQAPYRYQYGRPQSSSIKTSSTVIDKPTRAYNERKSNSSLKKSQQRKR